MIAELEGIYICTQWGSYKLIMARYASSLGSVGFMKSFHPRKPTWIIKINIYNLILMTV